MRCQHCGMNEATYHCVTNINGRRTEQHLCQECASKLGLTASYSPMEFFGEPLFRDPFPSFETLFDTIGARMLTEFPEPGITEGKEDSVIRSGSQEKEQSLLDSADRDRIRKERKLNSLKEQLNNAVKSENYELAAKLRDELKKLEG